MQRRLLLSNVVTTALFLLVLGLVTLWVGAANLRHQVEEGHRRLAVLLAKDIHAQYGHTVESVGLLRSRLEGEVHSLSGQAQAMRDLRLAAPLTYRTLYLFGATGDPLVSVAGPVEELAARPIEETIAPLFAQAPDGVLNAYRQTGSGGMFTSPVQIIGADRTPVLYMGMSLAGEDGQVLVVEVDLRSVWQRVDEVYAGQTGCALVVSRDGVIIAHPNRAYIGEPLPPLLRPVLDGYEGGTTYTDPLGGRVMLAAYSPVGKQSGWGIVVEQEYAEALAPLRAIALATLGVLLVAAAMATLVTVIVGRGIVRPLQTLEAAAQAIARTGEIDRRVAVGRRDEVGRLADAFDHMLVSLQERERWYQTLAEHAQVGVWQAGTDGNWQYVNPRLVEITGLTPEAAREAGWLSALHPEDREAIAAAWSAFVAGEAAYHATYRFQHSDGAVHWVIGQAAPARSAGGKLLGFIGTLTDITGLKRAEEALKEYAERLEEIVEERTAELRQSEEQSRAQYKGIPVPTYTWQKVGEDIVLVDYNDAAEAITQGRIADLVGIELPQMYRDTPEIRDEIARCFAEGITIEREMAYRFRSTGEERHLAVKYAFVPPDLVLVHTEDVTERVRVDEELRKQAAELKRMVNLMTGREVRMAELKQVIRKLRAQLEEAGLEPVANDPLLEGAA